VNFFKNFFKKKKQTPVTEFIHDCSVPPPVIACPKCKFGYAYGDHTEEQCAAAIKSMENPCPECNHPNHEYKEDKPDSGMCVQFIAGYGNVMPSICACGRAEWIARHEAKEAAKNTQNES
jgi:hypothetical protein